MPVKANFWGFGLLKLWKFRYSKQRGPSVRGCMLWPRTIQAPHEVPGSSLISAHQVLQLLACHKPNLLIGIVGKAVMLNDHAELRTLNMCVPHFSLLDLLPWQVVSWETLVTFILISWWIQHGWCVLNFGCCLSWSCGPVQPLAHFSCWGQSWICSPGITTLGPWLFLFGPCLFGWTSVHEGHIDFRVWEFLFLNLTLPSSSPSLFPLNLWPVKNLCKQQGLITQLFLCMSRLKSLKWAMWVSSLKSLYTSQFFLASFSA